MVNGRPGHGRIGSGRAGGAARVVFACGFALLAGPLGATPRIGPGDVIEIVVAGIPELRQRSAVQLDGTIAFPLLGTVAVAGLPAAEACPLIENGLASKLFRQRLPDGRENIVTIERSEVTATVVEYRPVTIAGDVLRSGEVPYRPAMTVRHALAVSGGVDALHQNGKSPLAERADLRGEGEALAADLLKEQARILRIRTELGLQPAAPAPPKDAPAIKAGAVPPALAAAISRQEADLLGTHLSNYQLEKAFLQRQVEQSRSQAGILAEQLKQEEAGVRLDTEELARVTELLGKGATTGQRVTDMRRNVLLSSTRQLQTAAQVMQMKKLGDEAARQLERLDDLRKAELLRDLQDATVHVEQITAKLRAVRDKTGYTFLDMRDEADPARKPTIVVVRKVESAYRHLPAEDEFELEPGDVVEVALPRAPSPRPPSQ